MAERIDKLQAYRQGKRPVKKTNSAWPLYGAGMEKFGRNGETIELPWPAYDPNELLVRHDACGLCSADVKLIRLGEQHPRITRNIKQEPVVPGHEVTLTVVGVGQNLRSQYQVGDRFIVQPDIYKDGVGHGYGFMLQGGLSQYAVLDERVLNGDAGRYLLPVQAKTGYAESALAEPWAAVVAAYNLEFRTGLKADGVTWIIGSPSPGLDKPYTISAGLEEASHPKTIWITNVPERFLAWLEDRTTDLGIRLIEVENPAHPPDEKVDDIILLGADADTIEQVSPCLAKHGIFAIVSDQPLGRKVKVDVGRIHYDRILYIGGADPDIAQIYSSHPVRSNLKSRGRVWFVGAGGPIGRMHVQGAVYQTDGPRTVFCTALHSRRLQVVEAAYRDDAARKGLEFVCISREEEAYETVLKQVGQDGFDDIMVLAPSASATEKAAAYLRPEGVLNVFTGVARGTMAELDLSRVYLDDVRFIGFSGSTIDDIRLTLEWIENHTVSPNGLVTAIGSLSAARDGLEAVRDSIFPGKVVIYPNIKDFPLTKVTDLKNRLPSVHAQLKNGREWTNEAEQEFLRLMADDFD